MKLLETRCKKCAECGHEWIKKQDTQDPKRCPNHKCRTVDWRDRTFVYVFAADPGYIKVGWTAEPKQRLSCLRSIPGDRSTRFQVDVDVKTIRPLMLMLGSKKLERFLHGELKAFRVDGTGEWYTTDAISKVESLNLPTIQWEMQEVTVATTVTSAAEVLKSTDTEKIISGSLEYDYNVD